MSAFTMNDNRLQFASLDTADDDDPEIRISEGLSHWLSFKPSGFSKARKSGYYKRRDGACAYKFQLEKDVSTDSESYSYRNIYYGI